MSSSHFFGVVCRAFGSMALRSLVFLLAMLGVGLLVPQTAQALTIHITGTSTASGVVGGKDAPAFSLQVSDAPVSNSECTVQGTGTPGPWSGPSYHWDPPVVSDTNALAASLTPDPATTGSVTLHLSYLKAGDYTVKLHATLGFHSSCGDAAAEDFKTINVHIDSVGTPQSVSVDARLSDGARATWVGQNIVNTTAQNQQLPQTLTGTGPLVYQLAVHQTNAAAPVPLRVSLSNWNTFAADGWNARFLATDATGAVANPPVDVTGAIISQNGWTCTPASNQEIVLRVEVTVPASAPAGLQKLLRIQSQAQDGTVAPPVDVVEIAAVQGVVAPPPSAQPDVSLERLSDGQSIQTVGQGILNDDARQTLSAISVAEQEQHYSVHIKNTGQNAAVFCVKMQIPLVAGTIPQPWAHQGWRASALVDDQTQNIASQLQSTIGWTTPSLAPSSEEVLHLSLISTVGADTDAEGSFRVLAQSGSLTDAVVGSLINQSVKSIEYSLDAGATWIPVPAGGVTVPQWSVLGLRGVRGNLSLPWPDEPFKSVWTCGQDTFVGDEVWLHCPTATAAGASGEDVQVECGNTLSLKVQVLPEDE